jgi:KUP system potassium uptake protein
MIVDKPFVTIENRYSVARTAMPNCLRIIIRHGYSEEVLTEDLTGLIYELLRCFVVSEGGTHRTLYG